MEAFKERILRAWVDGSENPDDWRRMGSRNYVMTASVDGVSLYTAPATAQVRSFPGAPYQEEPGIGYYFANAKGETARDFSGEAGGSPFVASFVYFFQTYDLSAVEWHLPEKAPEPRP